MTSPRNRKAKSTNTVPNKLLSALEFVSVAQFNEGQPYQTHCLMTGNRILASDGIVTAGIAIDDDLVACPHTMQLAAALGRCSEGYSITQLDNARLQIKSGSFKAFVPCIDPTSAFQNQPDPPIAVIDDRLKYGLATVAECCDEKSDKIHLNSVCINAVTVIGTNGIIMLEYWHGIDMPIGLTIPAVTCKVLNKVSKPFAKFGFSKNSVTFYYQDESWIKSQVYSGAYPIESIHRIFKTESKQELLPEGFYDALHKIEPFVSESDAIYFDVDMLRTHQHDDEGATVELSGIANVKKAAYNIKFLKAMKPHVKTVDFYCESKGSMAYFYGDNIRGVFMGITL